MRRTSDASAMRRKREIDEVSFVCGDVEEGLVRKNEPWKLWWKMERGFGDGGKPGAANGSESDVVGVDC